MDITLSRHIAPNNLALLPGLKQTSESLLRYVCRVHCFVFILFLRFAFVLLVCLCLEIALHAFARNDLLKLTLLSELYIVFVFKVIKLLFLTARPEMVYRVLNYIRR